MEKHRIAIASLVIAFYAWVAAVFFGALLMDSTYARLVPQASAAFSAVSDLLLPVGLLALVAGIVAIALAWKSTYARLCLGASLAVLLLEFLIPMLFPTLRNTPGTGFLTLVRIAINGAVSILAFSGLVVFLRVK